MFREIAVEERKYSNIVAPAETLYFKMKLPPRKYFFDSSPCCSFTAPNLSDILSHMPNMSKEKRDALLDYLFHGIQK